MPKGYFDNLNYTLGNEDSALELAAMPDKAGLVLAVAGSGARVVPLFAKNPRTVVCIDVSEEQLHFARLRIASFQKLDREEYLAFWGYPGKEIDKDERKRLFEGMELSEEARSFAVRLFAQNGWRPLLYAGKWEKAFKKISAINRKIVGKRGLGIFDCRTMREQLDYLQRYFPNRLWAFSVFLLGNAAVFNSLLYRGNFPKKNIAGPLYSFYMKRLDRLFTSAPVRENFFLQLLFFGKLCFPEGLSAECDPDVYARAKAGAVGTKIEYVRGDSIEVVKSLGNIDYLSLSDVPSYFGAARENYFLEKIKNSISPQGLVASRYYLRVPKNLDKTGYRDVTDVFSEAVAKEKTQMYSFGIYQRELP